MPMAVDPFDAQASERREPAAAVSMSASTNRAGADSRSMAAEAAWIEVIRKMDETYADLVRHQVELEEKNSALEDAQRFIASVLSSMTDVLIVCDVSGRVQQVNQALEDLVGRTEAELRGRSFLDLMAPASRVEAEGFSTRIRHEAVHDCEVALIGQDGDDAPLAMNCTSRYDHRGRLVGMVLMGRPVGDLREAYRALEFAYTQLKQAQTRLVAAEKMASLGRLVAGVAQLRLMAALAGDRPNGLFLRRSTAPSDICSTLLALVLGTTCWSAVVSCRRSFWMIFLLRTEHAMRLRSDLARVATAHSGLTLVAASSRSGRLGL